MADTFVLDYVIGLRKRIQKLFYQIERYLAVSELLSSEHVENMSFLDLSNAVTADSSGITSIVKTWVQLIILS